MGRRSLVVGIIGRSEDDSDGLSTTEDVYDYADGMDDSDGGTATYDSEGMGDSDGGSTLECQIAYGGEGMHDYADAYESGML